MAGLNLLDLNVKWRSIVSLNKPKNIITTKATVESLSKCHQGIGIAISTNYGEVIIIANSDYALSRAVQDMTPSITIDINELKDVTVFSSKNIKKPKIGAK